MINVVIQNINLCMILNMDIFKSLLKSDYFKLVFNVYHQNLKV